MRSGNFNVDFYVFFLVLKTGQTGGRTNGQDPLCGPIAGCITKNCRTVAYQTTKLFQARSGIHHDNYAYPFVCLSVIMCGPGLTLSGGIHKSADQQ